MRDVTMNERDDALAERRPGFGRGQRWRAMGGVAASGPPFLPRRSDPPVALGRLGSLEVRLARDAADLRRAQRLRYRVFFEEMAAKPTAVARVARRDADAFDPICDHLLVVDTQPTARGPFGLGRPKVVATCRLLPQAMAARHDGFYAQSEYDIGPLIARHPASRFLELGRSCVRPEYRDRRTVELLWHGIWAYVRQRRVDALFGCASLPGTDPRKLALPLSFLAHHARAEAAWDVRARWERRVAMDMLPREAVDVRAAMQALPPLVKGYLRLGARFGDGAVVDEAFGTTDVCVVLPVAAITPRYVDYFGADAERRAA